MKSYNFIANLKYSCLQSYFDVSFVCISSLKKVIHWTMQHTKSLPLCGLNHIQVWFNTEPVVKVNMLMALRDVSLCQHIFFLKM